MRDWGSDDEIIWESDFDCIRKLNSLSRFWEIMWEEAILSDFEIIFKEAIAECEKWFWGMLLWKVLLKYEEDETGSSKFWAIKINLYLIC
jgi:hypothetical protein